MSIFFMVVVLALYVRFTPNNDILIDDKFDINTMSEFYDIDNDGYVDRFVDADGNMYNSQGVRIYDSGFDKEDL